MAELKKIYACTEKDSAKGKAAYIYEDVDGWFWIKKYVEDEGFKTPFNSIEEIEVFLDIKFEVRKEVPF